MTVVDCSADSGGRKFHLSVLIGRAVIEVEPGRFAILGNGGFYNGHQVDEVVIEEDINAGNKTTGIVN